MPFSCSLFCQQLNNRKYSKQSHLICFTRSSTHIWQWQRNSCFSQIHWILIQFWSEITSSKSFRRDEVGLSSNNHIIEWIVFDLKMVKLTITTIWAKHTHTHMIDRKSNTTNAKVRTYHSFSEIIIFFSLFAYYYLVRIRHFHWMCFVVLVKEILINVGIVTVNQHMHCQCTPNDVHLGFFLWLWATQMDVPSH